MSVLQSDGRSGGPPPPDPGLPLLRLAFRPFFLFGALFSACAIALWALMVTGTIGFEVFGGSLWWHSHEMLFGFFSAIAVGFLLTAVQTWTGLPGIKGLPLAGLFLLWLAARLLLLLPWLAPVWVVSTVDLLFLPIAAVILAYPIVRKRQWRNGVFLPILVLMTAANGLSHYSIAAGDAGAATTATRSMVMLVSLLMTVVAGRVTPMFTANGTNTGRVPPQPILEALSPLLMVLALFAALAPQGAIAASVLGLAALCQAARVLRWRTWITFGTPLVWSLHLSYWAIALGLGLWALAKLGVGVSESEALHMLTVGAMGTMILAMIARVSLGHTGRMITVGGLMATAFGAVIFAAVVRVFGASLGLPFTTVMWVVSLLWLFAYGAFVCRYLGVLLRPRIDGRPG